VSDASKAKEKKETKKVRMNKKKRSKKEPDISPCGDWNLRDVLEGKVTDESIFLQGHYDRTNRALSKIEPRGRGFKSLTPFAKLPPDRIDLIFGENPEEFEKHCGDILPPDEAEPIIQRMLDTCCCPAQQEVLSVLKVNGFELARSKKHNVWVSKRLHAMWTTPKTPGDIRSWKNNLTDLQMKLRYQNNRYQTPATKISPDQVISAEEALKAHNRRKKG
jgi:hypothetical protein